MLFRYPPDIKDELAKFGRFERMKLRAKATHEANMGARGALISFVMLALMFLVLAVGLLYFKSEGFVVSGVVLVFLIWCMCNDYFIMQKMVYPKLRELLNVRN